MGWSLVLRQPGFGIRIITAHSREVKPPPFTSHQVIFEMRDAPRVGIQQTPPEPLAKLSGAGSRSLQLTGEAPSEPTMWVVELTAFMDIVESPIWPQLRDDTWDRNALGATP